MQYLCRNFFYAVGFVLLFSLRSLSPDFAQFKDLVEVLNASLFWELVFFLTILLSIADLFWKSGSARIGARKVSFGSCGPHETGVDKRVSIGDVCEMDNKAVPGEYNKLVFVGPGAGMSFEVPNQNCK